MNISGFSHMDGTSFPPVAANREHAKPGVAFQGDVVDIQSMDLDSMDELDAENLLADTIDMISLDQGAALAAHGGLTYGRVAELLSM